MLFLSEILRDLLFTFSYLDDTFISSSSQPKHLRRIGKVLQRLENGLRINIQKTNFSQETIECLGYKIEKTGFSIPPEKMEAVRILSRPQTISQLRQQLEMLNASRSFTHQMADTLAPLV